MGFFGKKYVFLFVSVVLLLESVLILFYPGYLIAGGELTIQALAFTRIFAVGCFAVGVLSFQGFKRYDADPGWRKVVLLTGLSFNLLLAFISYSLSGSAESFPPVFGLAHAFCAALLAVSNFTEE